MKLAALRSLIGVGSHSAKKNAELISILATVGVECAQVELRGLINSLRLDPMEQRVLCAGQSGYFWAANREEADCYLGELHQRNSSQFIMEQSIRSKINKLFEIIDEPFILSMGFEYLAERTWYNQDRGLMLKKSSDIVNYPYTYGLFLRTTRIALVENRLELRNMLAPSGLQLDLF